MSPAEPGDRRYLRRFERLPDAGDLLKKAAQISIGSCPGAGAPVFAASQVAGFLHAALIPVITPGSASAGSHPICVHVARPYSLRLTECPTTPVSPSGRPSGMKVPLRLLTALLAVVAAFTAACNPFRLNILHVSASRICFAEFTYKTMRHGPERTGLLQRAHAHLWVRPRARRPTSRGTQASLTTTPWVTASVNRPCRHHSDVTDGRREQSPPCPASTRVFAALRCRALLHGLLQSRERRPQHQGERYLPGLGSFNITNFATSTDATIIVTGEGTTG